MNCIVVRGAREHNLKNINLKLPRGGFITITGVSGSGKSSLAFDTIYAEGNRRYLESLSSYARQFLHKVKQSDVDYVGGLSPSIAIEQRQGSYSPRSTVGTVTEVYDYLRLLYSKVGDVFCPDCNIKLGARHTDEIADELLRDFSGHRFFLFAPVARGKKGELKGFLKSFIKKGFIWGRIDGDLLDMTNLKLAKNKQHNLDLLVDKIKITEDKRGRLLKSIETAFSFSGHSVLFVDKNTGEERYFSLKYSCPNCSFSFSKDMSPNIFSFNSPYGACKECHGLGRVVEISDSHLIVDDSKPILSGALNKSVYRLVGKYFVEDMVLRLCNKFGVDFKTEYRNLPDMFKEEFLLGGFDVEGIVPELEKNIFSEGKGGYLNKFGKLFAEKVCPVCSGKRLDAMSLSVRIGGFDISELSERNIGELLKFFDNLDFEGNKKDISRPVLSEIRERLLFLDKVGLSYLSLSRKVSTLGGGEYQRIRLGAQLGVGLSGVLYVLDEPSIGLHPSDNKRLIESLIELKRLNNTVIVVEHDEETILNSDYVVELGPCGGEKGGYVMESAPLDKFLKSKKSLTAKYLRGEYNIEFHSDRKVPGSDYIKIYGAEEHNLNDVDVSIPIGLFTVITGVSGSGKSTLMHDILAKALRREKFGYGGYVGKYRKLEGSDLIDKIIEIDQSPIGKTNRSIPATYVGFYSHIRKLFSETYDAKIRGYKEGRFSFNLKEGRCPECNGEGVKSFEMSFLPDVAVVCDMCGGRRFNEDTLSVYYKGKNISDVLNMDVSEALQFFSSVSNIREKLEFLKNVGLGYMKLGQSSATLSGGEAQRIKLAKELSKKSGGKTLYLLDEPTTGLHKDDIKKLIKTLLDLRDKGNTLVVIEHNIDIISVADYIIDLGPGGGVNGGSIIYNGPLSGIFSVEKSLTGKCLKQFLEGKFNDGIVGGKLPKDKCPYI